MTATSGVGTSVPIRCSPYQRDLGAAGDGGAEVSRALQAVVAVPIATNTPHMTPVPRVYVYPYTCLQAQASPCPDLHCDARILALPHPPACPV